MDLIELKRAYPRAWHSTFAGGWQRITESPLGLTSTAGLLDHYGISGEHRAQLEREPRPASEWLEADGLPPALIRDQKPLLPVRRLERVLGGSGMSVGEWCLELNCRSYFFVRDKPLERLLGAYLQEEHDVLVIDARQLVDRYAHAIKLSAINTGAIAPANKHRGPGTFVPIADYPAKPSGAPLRPVAEITVTEPIRDIAEITLKVERRRGAEVVDIVWQRPGLVGG